MPTTASTGRAITPFRHKLAPTPIKTERSTVRSTAVQSLSIILRMTTAHFILMTGTGEGVVRGFRLTRSRDIPGTVLNFTTVTPAKVRADAQVSFNLNVTGTSGRCSISDQPYSTNSSMTEYRFAHGRDSAPVTFWAYSSGYANIVIYINDYAIDSLTYSTYRLSDFSTVTKAASSGYMNVYSPVTKVITKYHLGEDISGYGFRRSASWTG